MTFAVTGIYTPPTGAEDATPGTVIRSATWNTVFTDIAAALTQLGMNGTKPILGTVSMLLTLHGVATLL